MKRAQRVQRNVVAKAQSARSADRDAHRILDVVAAVVARLREHEEELAQLRRIVANLVASNRGGIVFPVDTPPWAQDLTAAERRGRGH